MALALARRFAAQGRRQITLGTLPSDTVTFGVLVFGTIVLVGALSFLPALALGPITEFLQLVTLNRKTVKLNYDSLPDSDVIGVIAMRMTELDCFNESGL